MPDLKNPESTTENATETTSEDTLRNSPESADLSDHELDEIAGGLSMGKPVKDWIDSQ